MLKESGKQAITVVVAGASGYVGKALLCQLLANNAYTVRALTRNRETLHSFQNSRLEVVEKDVAKQDIEGICDGADIVISVMSRRRERGDSPELVDYLGNKKIFEDAKKHQVSRFIYLCMMQGEKIRDKVSAIDAKERFVDLLKIPINLDMRRVVIRASGFLKDLDMIFQLISKKQRMVLIGDATCKFNPIDASGLAQAIIEELEEDLDDALFAQKNIGGPDVTSLKSLSLDMFHLLRIKPKFICIPKGVFRFLMRVVGLFSTPVFEKLQMLYFLQTTEFLGEKVGSDHIAPYLEKLNLTRTKERG